MRLKPIDVCIPSLKLLDANFETHLRQRIPIHCLLTSDLPGRGRARQDLISRVDTDWFAFVDTDVRLRPNWWDDVCSMVSDDVGAVEGLWSYALTDRTADNYSRAMSQLAKLVRRKGWEERVERGFTGDTLIRTAAVRGISIPPGLHFYEDEFIRRYVIKMDFSWLRTGQVACDHLRKYNLDDAYDSGRYAFYFGQTNLGAQLRRFPLIPLKALFAVLKTSDVGILPFVLKRETRVFRGVVHASTTRSTTFPSGLAPS